MKSNFTKSVIALLCLMFSIGIMKGQDIHLSHIHASPTLLNPAMNGLFMGQARLIANSRSQWNSVTKGYTTAVASADMRMFVINRKDFISGGIQLFADRAGDLNFTTTSAALSFSYLKSFDKLGRNFISIGIQNGYVSNRVDFSKIKTFDHISAMGNAEMTGQINYWDINAGIGWFYKPTRYNSYYIGFSAFHLNNPNVGFRNELTSENALTAYRRFNLHGGATLRFSPAFTLKPSFLFMDQGPHQEITIGSFIRYKTYKRGLHKKPLYFIYFGGWIRSYLEKDIQGIDAFVASMKYEYRQLSIAISYDINLSKYRLASGGRGGLEFSIIRIFDWTRAKRKNAKVKCPIL